MLYDAREAIVRGIISGNTDELKQNLKEDRFKSIIEQTAKASAKLAESGDVSGAHKQAEAINDSYIAIATTR